MKTICFVASKSGGHILPCVNLAYRYKKEDLAYKTALITGSSSLDRSLADEAFDEKLSLILQPFLYKKIWRWPSFFISFLNTVWRSYQFLSFIKADTLISTGGFIGIPVSIAAWLLGIPLDLYELNATPGKASRVLALLARSVKVTFKQCLPYFGNNAVLVHYPLALLKQYNPQQARRHFNLSVYKKTITLIGGSQGSVFINTCWSQWIQQHAQLIKDEYTVIHQHGSSDNWDALYAHHGIEAYTTRFTKDIAALYSASSCIIMRAGAGSLFEIIEFKLPALIIPLPMRLSSHQYDNAQALAVLNPYMQVLCQESIEQDPLIFDQQIKQLLSNSLPLS